MKVIAAALASQQWHNFFASSPTHENLNENGALELLPVLTACSLSTHSFFTDVLRIDLWSVCGSAGFVSFTFTCSNWLSSPAPLFFNSKFNHDIAFASICGKSISCCNVANWSDLCNDNQYRRITVNKLSLAFFLFSFIHCFAQGITQSFLYSLDSDSSTLVSTILRDARVPRRELAWLTGYADNFQLHLCTNVPFGRLIGSCTTLFESSNSNASVPVPAGLRRMVCESRHDGWFILNYLSRRKVNFWMRYGRVHIFSRLKYNKFG